MADMTPDTATNQECRDYIAECRGWSKKVYGPPEYRTPFPITQWEKDGDVHCNHPIDDTIDAAYAALPPGWMWVNIAFVAGEVTATAVGPDVSPITGRAPDHKLALLRTACKAWAVVRGNTDMPKERNGNG